MAFAATNYNVPNVPDGVAAMADVGGYLVSVRSGLPGPTGNRREWAAFNLSNNTSRVFEGVGSSGTASRPYGVAAYGGYAWVSSSSIVHRLNPVTGGVTYYTYENALGVSNRTLLVGSTLYISYLTTTPYRLVSVDLSTLGATNVGTILNSDSYFSSNPILGSDGALWGLGVKDGVPGGNLLRVTLGGTSTAYNVLSGVSNNVVELGGWIYWSANAGRISRFNIGTQEHESFVQGGNNWNGDLFVGMDNRVYATQDTNAGVLGLDPSSGLMQSGTIPGVSSSSSNRIAKYRRPNGQVWVASSWPLH